MNNAILTTKLQSFTNKAKLFHSEDCHKSGLIDNHEHFMCTIPNAMELVRILGQVHWA